MAFSGIELKRIQQVVGSVCKRRSPISLRDKIRVTYEITDLEVVIFESRPRFNKPNEWSKSPRAKLKYSRSTRKWKLYRIREDEKWYPYETETASTELDAVVAELESDRSGAFFGRSAT